MPASRIQLLPAAVVILLSAIASGTAAQSLPVASSDDAAVVRQLWSGYLASKRGLFASNAGTPSRAWLASEQAKWPMYDLAGFYLPDRSVPVSVTVQPTSAGGAPEFEIVTRFADGRGKRTDSASAIVLTVTVYGVRSEGTWVLANALPRKTAAWDRHEVGQITYFVEPGLRFNRQKARHAAAFVDSLASAFSLPSVRQLDYYVTSSVDASMRILGAETPETFGPHGGFSKPVNRQVFSGIPSLGEDYRHELTHVVLLPLSYSGLTLLASEGVATWLGGSAGADFRQTTRNLAKYLAEHPDVSLDSIMELDLVMESVTPPLRLRYAAGAVLCAMLNDSGGAAAIKSFLQGGPGNAQLRATLARELERPWAAVLSDWRTAVIRISST